MNEYQDQDVWFELYGYDGMQKHFIADFDSREEAVDYDLLHDFGYDYTKIYRTHGVM